MCTEKLDTDNVDDLTSWIKSKQPVTIHLHVQNVTCEGTAFWYYPIQQKICHIPKSRIFSSTIFFQNHKCKKTWSICKSKFREMYKVQLPNYLTFLQKISLSEHMPIFQTGFKQLHLIDQLLQLHSLEYKLTLHESIWKPLMCKSCYIFFKANSSHFHSLGG